MKKENIILILILLLGVLLRFLYLSDIPYRVDGDASRFALDGLMYWQTKPPFFATGWYGHTNAYVYLVGFFLQIFKNDLLGLRVLSALGGFLGVLATYFFVKKLFDHKTAAWAALYLALSPFHLAFSRNGMEVVWMTFFAPITLFFILKKKPSFALLSGLFTGLAQYFSPAARIIPIYVFITLFIILINKKLILKKLLFAVVFWITGFVLVYFPQMLYYFSNPEAYWTRINIVGILNSGWLQNELKTRSLSNILWTQIANSLLAFHYPIKTSLAWFYRTPFLDPIPMVLFTVGLIIGLTRIKKWQYQLLYFYLVSSIFFAGVLTTPTPTTSRYIILFPVIACFIGIGTVNILDLVVKYFKFNTIFVIFLTSVLIITSAYSYWGHETYDTWKFDKNTQIATYAGKYLAQIGENYNIYFLGNDYMYYGAVPALPFLTKKPGVDIKQPVSYYLGSIKTDEKSFFIILPDREAEIDILKENFPKGKIKAFYNPLSELLFFLFET